MTQRASSGPRALARIDHEGADERRFVSSHCLAMGIGADVAPLRFALQRDKGKTS